MNVAVHISGCRAVVSCVPYGEPTVESMHLTPYVSDEIFIVCR